MNKRVRQYMGVLAAVLAYYVIHEGAHLVYALLTGVFQRIRFMGLGVQIVICAEQLSSRQLCVFCAVGACATGIAAYALVLTAPRICRSRSKVFRACMYYITIAMLLADPVYLSLLCVFFGGGDMNGIALCFPELWARLFFGVLLAVNSLLFWKGVLPQYRASFAGQE